MGFVDVVKQVINTILVILGLILNWWAICAVVGIISNKALHNKKIADMAWNVSLMPDVIKRVEEWVRS